MQVLAADVGATKTNIALTEVTPGKVVVVQDETVSSLAWESLKAMISHFLNRWQASPRVASFSVAGTVHPDQTCFINRLGWRLSAGELGDNLSMRVKLTYDSSATAVGIDLLGPDDIRIIRAGLPDKNAAQAVVCLGTGFGAATRLPGSNGYYVRPTRAGLMDFAPVGEQQIALTRYLCSLHGCEQVNFDLILGGRGLQDIVKFIVHDGNGSITEEPATILSAAKTGDNPRYKEALRLLVRMFGQAAGNLALAHSSTGGLLLAGGLAAKLAWALEPDFFTGFNSHGRAQDWLSAIPVSVVMNEKAPLLGAAILGLE